MATNKRSYSREFREEAVREVRESKRSALSVARSLGIHESTLRTWVRNAEQEEATVVGDSLSVSERARLRELERENRRLTSEIDFLGKACAYFAQKRP